MSRYDDLITNLGKSAIFCNNLGFGEQGAVLSNMPKSIFVCPDINTARNMKTQLDALCKDNVLIDDFGKPFTLTKFQSNQNKIDTLFSMYKLCTGNPIIISTPQILFSHIINPKMFEQKLLHLSKGQEYSLEEIEKSLINTGYKKVETVSSKGEFSRRGDIIDIFNITCDNPIRLDFFDTMLDEIYSFDFLSFERTENLKSVTICPCDFNLFDDKEKQSITSELNKYKFEDNLFFDLISKMELDDDIPLEYLSPFTNQVLTFAELDIPIVFSEHLKLENIINTFVENTFERIDNTIKNENIKKLFKNNKKYLKINEFYNNYNKNLIFFDNFDLNSTELKNKLNCKIFQIDFNTINMPSFLYNLSELKNSVSNLLDKQIYLCLSSKDTLSSVKKIFDETATPYSTNKNSKGIILTKLDIPYNICFADDEKLYIGSSNFAHKKQIKQDKKSTIKYLPKAGEYVVHSTHGIGKCEGVVTVTVSGVDKEFFKLTYRGGDTLYVPYENADCLSLYIAEGNVNLNKLGGKEFATQKLKAIKSIEDMSQELLELYAKRKAVKGFKYSEDDYLYTEFENSFEFDETADQLQAIADIKKDMCAGKVMDRLICGDVGFGKTEVAMRALFKAVENGKQVAILAPTTILSLQHCMTATKRTKDFGIKVEMLNRFKSDKEQKQILQDLSEGKINVICGTHRLLSSDVKFNDLGLLILDEEQRFGVKAKEHIKQIKNNVNVLTLSATPIPRTLSMTLMNIRDISIINTPPVNRLPVKTYVLGYNEDIVANAINDEINRDGQVLVVYNNVEKIHALANKLKEKVNNPKANFNVAHGQMSEISLENAVKRLYDKETNVFVSTTLIENGVDLPSANTLIVIDSDRLGLSQMYQLRGRVGRNADQAYAYFTYNKDKVLSEDSTNRLQAIAEHTELGSGFKIAMRDLQIRGTGELLGKVQHGHMIKIGYDMYAKLLNDTLKRLRGEKVEIEREIKIDIAITSKIPYTFVEDETERLKIIAKISNITDKDSARAVLNELIVTYGKLPKEIYQLTNIALIKALSNKQKVKQITINKAKMSIVFYDDIELNKLMKKVERFSHFRFEKTALPTICLNNQFFSVQTAMNYIIEFLNA
ncbi:MAG: transcription-repair coupling factor [Clostridia bacterium]|nr:transcription-repair coupling factor [Clostridia bacterium]